MYGIFIGQANVIHEGVNDRISKASVLDEGSEFVQAKEEFKSTFGYCLTLFTFELWKRGGAFV